MENAALKRIVIRVSIVSGCVILLLVAVAAAQHWSKSKGAAQASAKHSAKPAATKAGTDVAASGKHAAADLMAAAQEAAEPAMEADPFRTVARPTPADDRYADYYTQTADAVTETVTEAAEGTGSFVQEATEPFVPVTPLPDSDTPTQAEASYEDSASGELAPALAASETAPPDQPADDRLQQWPQEATATVEESNTPTDEESPYAPTDATDAAPVEAESNAAEVTEPASRATIPDEEPLAPVEPSRWGDGHATESPLGERESPREPAPTSRLQSAAQGAGIPGDPKLESEQGAALVIHKTGPPEVQLGIETTYEIRVQNVGDAPAHDVEVHDVAPRGADLVATQPRIEPGANGELVWALGTLAPGDEVTVQMRVTPRAEGEIGSVARVYFSADAAVRTLVTRPQLELSVEAPKSVLAGERAQFFVRVTNTGTGVATGLVLEEIVPAGFEHPAGASLEYRVGTLKPRESRELPLTLSAVKPGEAVNVVSARADGDILVEHRTPVAVVAPALQVEMQGPRRRFLDRDATYTVAVKNPGTAPAKEIELVTFLAPGMEFVAADSAGQYDPETRAVYWLLDELPPNEMGSVTVTARPTKPGEHVLRVEGRAQRGLEDAEEQAIVVEGLAAVEFQVIDLADPVEINGEAAYEIVVKNGGTKTAENVELMAMLPVEMQLISADGPTRHQIAGQKLTFEPIGSLPPGATATFQLTAKTVDAGDARLQVKLITAEMESPVTKEENTKVFGDE